MFHYPSVQQRHTGSFSTIWLAATGATKLVKREYMKVNISKTCEEIISYILVRVPPPIPRGTRPRFSLDLSAQLQFGVVLVYSRQCQYLIEEIKHIVQYLNQVKEDSQINLAKLEQTGLLLPNRLALMKNLEESPDPFFGIMEPLLPGPFLIPHVRCLLEAPTPERSLLEQSLSSIGSASGCDVSNLPTASPIFNDYSFHFHEATTSFRSMIACLNAEASAAVKQPLEGEITPHNSFRCPGKSSITASPEMITLKEYEPIILLKIEGEQDLPEITLEEIKLLEEQKGFLVPGVEEEPLSLQAVVRKRHVEEESVEKAVVGEPLVSIGMSPPTGAAVEMMVVKEMGPLLTEEIEPSVKVPVQTLEITLLGEEPRFPPAPSLPEVRAKRKQPLSPELQLAEYELSPPHLKRRRRQLHFMDKVTQISSKVFQKQISDPHTQCRPLAKVLLPAKRLKTTAELLNNPAVGWMHPTLHGLWARCVNIQNVNYAKKRAEEKKRRAETVINLEMLRVSEKPNGLSESSSELSLEATEDHPSLVIPEERLVVAKLEQVKELDFDQLVPLTTPQAVASRFFSKCLVLAKDEILCLEQKEAYGQILMKPGKRFPRN